MRAVTELLHAKLTTNCIHYLAIYSSIYKQWTCVRAHERRKVGIHVGTCCGVVRRRQVPSCVRIECMLQG